MQYVCECLQLLYWMFFKPYTLKQHVRGICPEITNPYADNFFRRSAEARANPRLQRYDDQCWWLTALVPMAAVALYAPLAEGILRLLTGPAAFQFNWLLSSLFLLGWLLGQLLFRAVRKKLNEKTFRLFIVAAPALFAVAVLLTKQGVIPDRLLRGTLVAAALGAGFGAGFAAEFGVAFGVTLGVAFGVAGGVGIGVAFGVAFGLAVGVGVGIVVGMEVGVGIVTVVGAMLGVGVGAVVGAVGGVAVGMAVGVSCILGVLRIYFWLPELLWTLLLKLAPFPAVRRLRLLPPQFDQVIIFPLPFLPGFIAEAYQENQAAARQTIDYLITSTNQQKTATKAISRIAVEECGRCHTAGDIATLRRQLDWLPGQQAGGLTACLEISQDVTAALEGSSPYRQARQLDRVCQEITRQRNRLASASAREATAFGSVLDSWQRILETARTTLREQARHSGEIPQEYLAGPALDPNKAGTLFKGRRDLFRQIETLTLSAQHPTLVMYGGRRTGKTSTLNYLPKWMPSDILPLLVDVQHLADTITLSGFAEEFADQIIKSAHKMHHLKLPSPDTKKLALDPFVALRHWLDAVEQVAPDKTLLICLDEFERLDEIVSNTGSRAPLNFLRHLIQHRDRWTLLFAGAHMPEELPDYWSDYLINSQTLRVSYLAKDDTLTLIKEPVEDFPAIYPDEVAEAIWRLTNGQPYFTQLLCHELVEHLNRVKEKTVRMSDLEAVLPAVFERGYQVFREFWDALTEGQRELLLALAEERPPGEEGVKVAPIAPMLVRKEILAQDEGGWSFRVPLLRRWILTQCED